MLRSGSLTSAGLAGLLALLRVAALSAQTQSAAEVRSAGTINLPAEPGGQQPSGVAETAAEVDWRTIRPVPSVRTAPPAATFAGENGRPTVAINAEAIDISQVLPLTYHAVAVRLADGQRPRIDGRMNDEVWQRAPAFGNFVQTEPEVGRPANQPTEFRILYDDRSLYLGFWLFDDQPLEIRASELKRDALLRKGDQIKVTINTFNDRRNAFYFGTNPLGAYKDGNMTDNGRTQNWDWTVNWQTSASKDDHGWYTELEIPLSQLRYPEGVGETIWGLQVCRVVIRTNENSCWTPYPREWGPAGVNRMSGAGLLHGITDLKALRPLELVPYVQPVVLRDYTTGAPTKVEASYGMDLRVGLTPTLNADLTIKTDFAQVEADQEVVNLSRFSIFFPEKRQFFTEAAGVFDYGAASGGGGGGGAGSTNGLLQLYYSRRIGLDAQLGKIPIAGGGRVTGRVGEYSVGLLNIQTQRKTVVDAAGQVRTVPTANYSVVRVKRNILAQSSIGALVTNRQDGGGIGSYNRSAGLDMGLQLGQDLTVTGLLAKTFTPGTSGKDMAGAIDVTYQNDRVNAGATYLDIAERFNAEMGFIRRTDIRNTTVRGGWTPWPGWSGVKNLDFSGSVDYFQNHAGIKQSQSDSLGVGLVRPDNSRVRVAFEREFDLLTDDFQIGRVHVPAGSYAWNSLNVNYSSDQSRRIYGGGQVNTGDYYNGERTSFGGNLAFLPLETLLVELDYTRNHVMLPSFAKYVTNTVNTRVSHSFTPDLFVKGFVQYNDARRLANLNLMLWYRYLTGSDLYVVYNQGWDTEIAGRHSLNTRDRSIQIKLTYWLAR
jgi:hypothetical protein